MARSFGIRTQIDLILLGSRSNAQELLGQVIVGRLDGKGTFNNKHNPAIDTGRLCRALRLIVFT